MISPEMRTVLHLVDAGQVYWSRSGGSSAYRVHRELIKEAIKEGLVIAAPLDCCRKDYILTVRGDAARKA